MVLRPSKQIEGVFAVALQAHGDERGRFAEVFRKEWFPQRSWERLQWSRSESQAGTLRGLHYHHRQVDYWHCARGRMRVGLFDLRRSSPTRGRSEIVALDGEEPAAIFIPVGVAHGFYALTDVMLFYLVDNYYDGTDEMGVAWDDEEAELDWGVAGEPILSQRDLDNPPLAKIARGELPE